MEFNSGDCYDYIVTKNYLNLMSTNLKKCEFLIFITNFFVHQMWTPKFRLGISI